MRTQSIRTVNNLTGTTYASAENATTTIVASGSNTKGVEIYYLMNSVIGDNYAGLTIAGNKLFEHNANANTTHIIEFMLIPPGVDVALVSEGAFRRTSCYYKIRT